MFLLQNFIYQSLIQSRCSDLATEVANLYEKLTTVLTWKQQLSYRIATDWLLRLLHLMRIPPQTLGWLTLC